MKILKLLAGLVVLIGVVFTSGVVPAEGKAAPKKEVFEKVVLPKGEVVYTQDFEEEDELDSWMSDISDVSWQKGGANGSKGCIKIGSPIYEKASSNGPKDASKGYLEGEKYIEFEDLGTVIDFDYFLNGVGDEIYVRGISAKVGYNVYVKDPVKGKWAHAQVKAAEMSNDEGELAKGLNFRTHAYIFNGADKKEKDPYVLIDNVVITQTKTK